jgi:hypothetical protein
MISLALSRPDYFFINQILDHTISSFFAIAMPKMPNTIWDPYPKTKKEGGLFPRDCR